MTAAATMAHSGGRRRVGDATLHSACCSRCVACSVRTAVLCTTSPCCKASPHGCLRELWPRRLWRSAAHARFTWPQRALPKLTNHGVCSCCSFTASRCDTTAAPTSALLTKGTPRQELAGAALPHTTPLPPRLNKLCGAAGQEACRRHACGRITAAAPAPPQHMHAHEHSSSGVLAAAQHAANEQAQPNTRTQHHAHLRPWCAALSRSGPGCISSSLRTALEGRQWQHT
jgi:hypothetical protein